MKNYPKICEICYKSFYSHWNHTKVCSPNCAKEKMKIIYNSKPKRNKGYLYLRFRAFNRDKFTCQYCGRNVKEDKIKLHLDHINPKSRGGKDILENLITSCMECNLGKSDILI